MTTTVIPALEPDVITDMSTSDLKNPQSRPDRAFAGRPHGHVVGHGVGEPLPESFPGRPSGNVIVYGPADASTKHPERKAA